MSKTKNIFKKKLISCFSALQTILFNLSEMLRHILNGHYMKLFLICLSNPVTGTVSEIPTLHAVCLSTMYPLIICINSILLLFSF